VEDESPKILQDPFSEPADEPVDPASEQNHMGPLGQFLTSLDSSGSVGL